MILTASLLGGNAALALAAAVTWGGGDFTGGMGVKQAGGSFDAALRVVLLSHGASLLVLISYALLRGDPVLHGAALAWSLASGLLGGASVLIFYICLARGAMGASAAISGLLAAAIPSAVSMLLEGPPGPPRLFGFLLAAAAIWLIAGSPGGERAPAGTLTLSVLSGAGFGFYFVALRMAGTAGVVWPIAVARSVSVCLCVLGLAGASLRRSSGIIGVMPQSPESPPVSRKSFRVWLIVAWAMGTAAFDTAGNLLFLAATRAGRLDVAAVLASLYPATTILLAAWLLRERPSRRQGFGMALAVAAVVLITR